MLAVVAEGFGLPEAPCWHGGRLYVADAAAGGVWEVPLDGRARTPVVEHRRGVAGLAAHADGGFVVGGRNLAWKRGDDTIVLAGARVNDLTTSAEGRVYAGTIDLDAEGASGSPGVLLMVDLDGRVTTVADALEASNGLAFAPDGQRLYHVDSGPRSLRVYDVAPDGALGAPRVVRRWDDGVPDGMAAAADGALLVAIAGAGYVAVLDPDGAEHERLPMPHAHVTSLCFGGPALTDLFVTLGGDVHASRRDGLVARVASARQGSPRPPARVLSGIMR